MKYGGESRSLNVVKRIQCNRCGNEINIRAFVRSIACPKCANLIVVHLDPHRGAIRDV